MVRLSTAVRWGHSLSHKHNLIRPLKVSKLSGLIISLSNTLVESHRGLSLVPSKVRMYVCLSLLWKSIPPNFVLPQGLSMLGCCCHVPCTLPAALFPASRPWYLTSRTALGTTTFFSLSLFSLFMEGRRSDLPRRPY